MARNKHSRDGEYSKDQRLRHEIKRLKRQNDQLRKQLARVDLERYQNVKDILEKHDQEERDQALQEQETNLKKIWECWECKQGVLQYIPVMRRDGNFYFRRCRVCGHRTRLKPWNKNVKEGP